MRERLAKRNVYAITSFIFGMDNDTVGVAERTLAKRSRNFARADAIRNDLLAKGILLEDSKDGVRWKRK